MESTCEADRRKKAGGGFNESSTGLNLDNH